MANIIDYLKWRGDLTFQADPINEVDFLILCHMSYLDFDGLLVEDDFKSSVTLKELAKKFKESPDFEKRSDTGVMINKQTVNLLLLAGETERYGNIPVIGYKSVINPRTEEQFAAVTYNIGKKEYYVCYRGTDDTVVGWKEDFNLAIYDEVAAQTDAAKYLQDAAAALKGNFIISGHSKGGNLAVFAAAKCGDAVKKRINRVYNFDGPGFPSRRLESQEFFTIIPKVISYYPQGSIIGMLFRHAGEYKVIASDQKGVMQHDPLSWTLMGNRFDKVESLDKTSILFNEKFNKWIEEIEPLCFEIFVETLFEVIHATGATTNSEIEKNGFVNFMKISNSLRKLPPELRNVMEEILKSLMDIMKDTVYESFTEFWKKTFPQLSAKK